MMQIEVGQVLSLKIRYNNRGDVSTRKHPYLVVKIVDENTIEIAQLDSLKGKLWKAAFESNKVIYADNPRESVIDQDSYIQNDNTIQIEYFEGLASYRRQEDKLSQEKLREVLIEYENYHKTHEIEENKQIYINKDELLKINEG